MGIVDESYKKASNTTFWRITWTTTRRAANATALHPCAPDEIMGS